MCQEHKVISTLELIVNKLCPEKINSKIIFFILNGTLIEFAYYAMMNIEVA